MRRLARGPALWSAAILASLGAACAWGQAISSSQVSGVVRDPAGAVVPSAAVKLTNLETGDARSARSEADGVFVIADVPVGQYKLEIAKDGFAVWVQPGFDLQVNQNPMLNVALAFERAAQEVTVHEDTPVVESHSLGVGQVIDESRVVDLPLNGRQVTQLVALAGAAVSGGAVGTRQYPNESIFSVAGGQRTETNFLLDGGAHMDTDANIGLPMPFPDAVREFKVETSSLAANYGNHPGGVVNVVTKSGSNEVHGDAFEFLRNYELNARNFFAATRDSLKRNQYGGVLGGPVKKDRIFFFLGYQGTITRSDPATNTAYVPTASVLAGDFTQILSASCTNGKQINLKAPYAGNKINPSAFNSVALKLASLIPVSTDPCGKIQYGILSNTEENQGIVRIDWRQSGRNSVFARWFVTDYWLPPTYTNNLLTSNTVGNADRVQSAVAGDTFVISPSSVNAFRAVFSRSKVVRVPATGVPTLTDLGSNVYSPIPQFTGTLSVSGYFSTGGLPGYYANNTFQLSDDVDSIRGAHQIVAGFSWTHNQLNGLGPFQQNAKFSFDGSQTGNALADYLVGLPASFGQGNGQIAYDRINIPSLYIQDSWRVRPGLTIQAGLRWDPFFPQHNIEGMVSTFDRSKFSQGITSKAFTYAPPGVFFEGDAGFPGRSNTAQKALLFSPRAGVVWDPRGKGREVIRAGYGIFRDTNYTWLMQHVPLNPPWGETISIAAPAGGLTNPWQGYAGGDPFPTPVPLPSNFPFPIGGVYVFMPANAHPMYTQQWNVTVEKQLWKNWKVSGSYLGNKGTHLWLSREINPAVYIPGTCAAGQYGLKAAGACSTLANTNQRRVLYLENPSTGQYFGSMAMVDDGGNANYHALLATVSRHFTRSFSLLSNYTWSHCIDDGDQSYAGDITNMYQDPNNRRGERASCTMDRRNIFNTSAIFQIPRIHEGLAGRLAENWQMACIFTSVSGAPLNITTGSDVALRGETAVQDRPNLVGTATLASPGIAKWFNTSAFTAAAAGSYGNLGRNAVLGPGQSDLDLSVSRPFPLGERKSLSVRAEAFNALNHARFGNPGTSLAASSTFGRITSASDPRIMQLAVKVVF